MNARELLETIEARGGVATVKRDGGAAVLNVAPRRVALELATDIQRFKPVLLELLAPEVAHLAPRVPLELDAPTLARTARRLEHRHPALWRSMIGAERLQMTVCAALLELKRDVPSDWEQWRAGGETR